MTKYTIVGDPHAKPDNLDKINQLFDILEQLGNPVIILGDLLDTKELVRARCLNTYLERLAGSNLDFTILTGNHDLYNVSSNPSEHSLQALKLLDRVLLVESELLYEDMLFVAYKHNPDDFRVVLKRYPKAKTIFCHADIVNFDYGTGVISTEGLNPEDFGGRQVISGHYHKYQKLGNITYLGTPFSHSFGEANQTKYLGVFDSRTKKLELIETNFPKHVSIEVDCDKTSELPKDLNAKDHVRFVLKGSEDSINRFPKTGNYKFVEEPNVQQTVAQISESDSSDLQFIKWAKDIKGYDQSLINLGLEVLKGV